MSETLHILNPHLVLKEDTDMPKVQGKRKRGRPKESMSGNLGELLKDIKADEIKLDKKRKRARRLHEYQGKQLE